MKPIILTSKVAKKDLAKKLAFLRELDDSISELDLPFVGYIAAGKPIEVVETVSYMTVPDALKTGKPCYVFTVFS